MPFTSIDLMVGFLVAVLPAFGLATVIGQKRGFFHSLVDREAASSRFHAIDGLRGFLALGVMLHHIHLNHHFYRTGLWELAPSRLSTFLGRGSVAFFFMITAFLFWGRAIDSKGSINTLKFYSGRVRRLVPMYLLSAGLLVLTALALTHFRLVVSPLDLVRQVLAWMLFTVPGYPEINGFRQTTLINTVFWSLVYEWKFYLVLPLIAALSRNKNRWPTAIIVCGCIAAFSTTQIEWFFVAGCTAAALVRLPAIRRFSVGIPATALALGCAAATVIYQPLIYTAAGAALLLIPFTIIASGNSLFGLLTCRPARVLGLLSYSIYLLHNWVLYLTSRLINHYIPVASLPKIEYWGAAVIVVFLTVVLSAITYRFIEYPGIRGVTATPANANDDGTVTTLADRP
ncbi:acyltransferase family protein [Paraburkholderia aspalathi]|uniref:acyltransferase family protein n=1 Tax=Paraburkholderia aspalathi TaxID=1324617 RepID=UPI0038B71E9B